jgi:hypothetical protein
MKRERVKNNFSGLMIGISIAFLSGPMAFADTKGWQCQCFDSSKQDEAIGGGVYDWSQATNLTEANVLMKQACLNMYQGKKPDQVVTNCLIRNDIQE